MGYTTYFTGHFDVSPPLTRDQVNYLKRFAETRRMQRDPLKTVYRDDPIRAAVGLPVGTEGGYFVGASGQFGQEYGAEDVINNNVPPMGQPGLWCQWTPSYDGEVIQWDDGEKFYEYIEWIRYLIANFIERWDRKLNGIVEWDGEDSEDRGRIIIENNNVRIQEAVVTFKDV